MAGSCGPWERCPSCPVGLDCLLGCRRSPRLHHRRMKESFASPSQQCLCSCSELGSFKISRKHLAAWFKEALEEKINSPPSSSANAEKLWGEIKGLILQFLLNGSRKKQRKGDRWAGPLRMFFLKHRDLQNYQQNTPPSLVSFPTLFGSVAWAGAAYNNNNKALLQHLCLQHGWRGVCYLISLVRWNFFHHASIAFNALHVMQFLFLGAELKPRPPGL